MDGIKGKGGYWTIDPTHMEKFKNGAFVRGSSSLLRRKPANNNSRNSLLSSPNSPDTPDTTTNSTAYPVMQIHNLLN